MLRYRYDECWLRYSNTSFFSKWQAFGYYLCNIHNATEPQQFDTILGDLMDTLISQAANNTKLFAAGFVNYTSFNKLYGLVQCTRDISKEDCNSCLKHAESYIPNYCGISIGGRLFGNSCGLQYDATYMFYNASAVANAAASPTPPSPPPPAGTTDDGNNGNKLILESDIFSNIQLS
jgi:Salt stress response/antifungal